MKLQKEPKTSRITPHGKGWVLVENGKIVVTSNNSIEVFKTKEALLDYYGGALGDLNAVKKVQLKVI